MPQKPIADKGSVCPFHNKDMSKVCHTCPLWIHIRGTNPNTGADEDRWSCAFAWLPVLMIENSQMQRQTGAAVESFRNAVTREHARDDQTLPYYNQLPQRS